MKFGMERFKISTYFGIVILIIIELETGSGLTVEEELTLNLEQKKALDLVKKDMERHITKDYMKTEAYLIKWLRAYDFNVDKVKNLLHNTLKWRAENQMDTILEEDFSFWEQEAPTYYDKDFENRPVIAIDIGHWDIRNIQLSGRIEQFMRYQYRTMEMSNYLIKESQLKGLNVTQSIAIINIKGFNVVQHGSGTPFLIDYILTSQKHYPGVLYKLFLINLPISFEIMLNAMRPVMNHRVRKALMLFGNNQNEWKNEILKFVPPENLPPNFGGTKKLNYDDY